MKKAFIVIGPVLIFLFVLAGPGIYIWIDNGVKKNIKIAKDLYPGKAEDALIAYLLDSTHSPGERSHIAVWTLGQIQSKKALPILRSFYKNDPEGKTCFGKHSYALCQYEICKALNAAESNWWPLHQRLNK